MIDSFLTELTSRVLAGTPPTRDEALRLAGDAVDLYDAMHCANRIRRHYRGDAVRGCAIISAKTGACGEDCAFCAQSSRWHTGVQPTGFCEAGEVERAAAEAARNGAFAFGVVASGAGIRGEKELRACCERLEAVGRSGIERHASLGFVDDGQIEALKRAGLSCYHHNLETSERFFPRVCTTHTYAQRVETLKRVREHGLRICSGALFGMGEAWEDRVDVALALRELGASSVPLNFLNPIAGTPLAGMAPMPPLEILRTVAIFRFVLFDRDIGVCGGREVNLRDLQSWIFYAGANALMIGNYLTTAGRPAAQDLKMIEDLGLRLERQGPGSA